MLQIPTPEPGSGVFRWVASSRIKVTILAVSGQSGVGILRAVAFFTPVGMSAS